MNPLFVFLFSISSAWTNVRTSSFEVVIHLEILLLNAVYLALLAGSTGFGLYWITKLIYQKVFPKKCPEPDIKKQEEAAESIDAKPEASESESQIMADSESQTNDLLKDSKAQMIQKTIETQTDFEEALPEIQKTSTMTQTDSEAPRTSRCTQTESPKINFSEIDLYVLYSKFCPHLKDDVIFVLNNVSMEKEKIMFNAEEFRFERIQCGCGFQQSELLPATEAKILFERDSRAYSQKIRIDRSQDGFLEKRILMRTILKERVAGIGSIQRWVQVRKEEPIVDRALDFDDSSDDSGDSDDSRYFEPDTASESDSEDLPVFDEPIPAPPFDMNDLNNLSLLRELREGEEEEKEYVKVDGPQAIIVLVDSDGSDDDDEASEEVHVETADPENPGFFNVQL